jgi:inosine-uridine nucleoside N-ribohydrolase
MFCSVSMRIAGKVSPRFLGVFLLALCLCQPSIGLSRDLLVITDIEPDDRIALLLLAAEFPEEIVSAGTSVMHAGRKQVLARQFLQHIGLTAIPVIQGSGGDATSYFEITSSRAARTYQFEGRGLLSAAELALINRDMPHSSEDLSRAIRSLLREHDDIEIVLLAPATDLVDALEAEPSLKTRIRHIHISAGWSEKVLHSGQIERRTSFNWNMDPVAGAALMSMKTIPMTLYSTHVIKSTFSGGSINKDEFPKIISELKNQRCRVPAFETFLIAANSWDQHVMETIPPLRAVIGDNAGYQFTPADPIVAVGMANAGFITSKRLVDVTIDLDDLDPASGFRVKVETDPSSNIFVVEAVDVGIFRQQVLRSLEKIATAAAYEPIVSLNSDCPTIY